MTKRYGVIDLGTNTFHLLIARQNENGGLDELYRKRVYVKLAENGIDTIGDAPFQRGLESLQIFKQVLEEYKVTKIKAFGTAALRTASNGSKFIEYVKNNIGLDITLIPGSEEARLIHHGVSHAVPLDENNGLIMDIGGGSVEFIIANKTKVHWAKSFPIGVAVLYNQFHKNDPITNDEVKAINSFLNSTLLELFTALKKYPASTLIGASGTFDVLESILVKEKTHPLYASLNSELFFPLHNQLLTTNIEQRLQMEGLPNSRADLVIVAMILIKFILTKTNTKKIIVSAYAMKEGILYEMIE